MPRTLVSQVFRYGAIGAFSAGMDFVAFICLNALTSRPIISSMLSISIGICVSFFLNSRYTFKILPTKANGFKFLIVGFGGMSLGLLLMQLLLVTGLDEVAAKSISIPAVALAQFVANKLWSFSK